MVDYVVEAKINHTTEYTPIRTLEGHLKGVDCVKFNPAQKNLLLSGSFDQTYRCWDVTQGACVKEVQAHDGGIWALDFSKDGKTFVTGSADKTIKLWDSSSFKEIMPLKGHGLHIYSVCFSPDNSQLLSSAEDGTMKIWDLKKGQVFKSIELKSKIGLSSKYTQDGKHIFVANADGQLVVYDTVNFNEIARTPAIPDCRAFSLALDINAPAAFSRNIFVGYQDFQVRRWKFDGTNLTLEKSITAHTDHCKHVGLYTSAGAFVTSGRDGSAKVWSAYSDELRANLVGASDSVTMSAFADDTARTVAVSSWDQRIRLYRLPEVITA